MNNIEYLGFNDELFRVNWDELSSRLIWSHQGFDYFITKNNRIIYRTDHQRGFITISSFVKNLQIAGGSVDSLPFSLPISDA